MKKITLLLICLSFSIGTYAQQTCATAQPISPGITTVTGIDGTAPTQYCDANSTDLPTFGEWFTYTATQDGYISITTNFLDNAGGDTNFHVYSGACGALVCVGGNDDVDADNTNYLSEFTFPSTNGTTYIIAFDDRWSPAGFDFRLTDFNCDYTVPYAETFDINGPFETCFTREDVDADGISWITQQNLDLDGDLVPETFATNGNSTAGQKNDWLFSPDFTLTAGTEYTVTTIFNTFSGNGSLEAFIVDAPSSTANQIASLFSVTDVAPQGEFATLETMAYQEINTFTPTADGDYHIAYRSFGPASSGFILMFDSNLESTLSVDEFSNGSFTYLYNKTNKMLALESTGQAFDNITMFNILGQQVINKSSTLNEESIDMSSLKDGLYIVKVSIQGQIKTIKILKQ